MALAGMVAGAGASLGSIAQAAEVTYAELAPILAARCVMCHSGVDAPLGLHLDTLDGLMSGSENGAVVKAGDPAGSELIRRLKGLSTPRMPMTGPPFLSDHEIALFEGWVAAGLPPGREGSLGAPPDGAGGRPAPGSPTTYAHVAQIFATRCARCHTERGRMGPAPEGYRLTSYADTLSAADRLRVVPGHPDASELVRRIRGQARPRMPFDGPPFLSAEEMLAIETWIAQGARNADGVPAPVPAGAAVRLHGTLAAGWRLDGLPLAPAPGARLDRRPRAGDYVEVRGRTRADGTILVERIRRR
jgi:mono/diheme cytochrome c family protein